MVKWAKEVLAGLFLLYVLYGLAALIQNAWTMR